MRLRFTGALDGLRLSRRCFYLWRRGAMHADTYMARRLGTIRREEGHGNYTARACASRYPRFPQESGIGSHHHAYICKHRPQLGHASPVTSSQVKLGKQASRACQQQATPRKLASATPCLTLAARRAEVSKNRVVHDCGPHLVQLELGKAKEQASRLHGKLGPSAKRKDRA